MKKLDYVVLGNGVSGTFFTFFLDRYLKKKGVTDQKIYQIYSNNLFKSVDPDIKIIISQNGIERDQSSLGDLLVDSFEFFEQEFVGCTGVTKSKQYFIYDHPLVNEEKFHRRFGNVALRKLPKHMFLRDFEAHILDSFIVDPHIFLKSITQNCSNTIVPEIAEIQSLSLSDTEVVLKSLSNETYACPFVCLSMGTFSKFLPINFLESAKLEKHKTVSGVVWTSVHDLGSEDFIVTIGMANLIYTTKDRQVQLSGVSAKTGQNLGLTDKMRSLHLSFSEIINLPDFHKGALTYSLRDKGKRRNPYSGLEINDNRLIMRCCGAYKNGYTTSPYLIKKLFDLI